MQANSPEDLLQFKDFSNAPSTSSPPEISVNSPTLSAASAAGSNRQRGDPLSELIYDMSNTAQSFAASGAGGSGAGGTGETNESANATNISFLTIEYYQKFFNVDTMMVLERIVNSMIPKRAGDSYLRSTIGANPDLYGPVWITITLVFSIAISGNIASYLQNARVDYEWRYNFHLVSYAATCIFLYVNFVPLSLWALFKYSLKPIDDDLENDNATYTPGLLTLMCVYGYSLSIYIPVSILWVIPISLMQWLLVITAALLSGSVLILVLSPALRNSKLALPIIAGILGAHFLLAAGFMLYFFHMPNSSVVKYEYVHAALKSVTEKAVKNAVVLNNATV